MDSKVPTTLVSMIGWVHQGKMFATWNSFEVCDSLMDKHQPVFGTKFDDQFSFKVLKRANDKNQFLTSPKLKNSSFLERYKIKTTRNEEKKKIENYWGGSIKIRKIV